LPQRDMANARKLGTRPSMASRSDGARVIRRYPPFLVKIAAATI
jgi:hypothetical protein